MGDTTQKSEHSLKRCLGLRETLTITTGTVIGVGLFTVGGNVVGSLGPWVIFATLAALAISVYPALLYAEMGAALPFSGGTYVYACRGLGRPFGMLAGWNFLISMISVASGEALAFSFYLRTLFEALGLPLPIGDRWLAAGAILLFILLGVRGAEMTGRMQNGFLFFFWGVAAVWVYSMLPHLQPVGPLASPSVGVGGFLPCVALVWWCFAGFETCCAMGGEVHYPQLELPRALFLAPFLVFAVNGVFQWVLVSVVPQNALAGLAMAAAPYAEGLRLAGVTGLPLVLLCMGIAFGGDFSTLNASISAPARYLYTMARDGALPAFFAEIHPRFHTPARACAALGALTLALVCTGSIGWIASLSLFATLLYYILGIGAAWALRRKEPGLARPYKAPGICLGAPVSIAVYALMLTQLEHSAIWAGLAWCTAGLVLYAVWGRRHFVPTEPEAAPAAWPAEEERKRMDREYARWKLAVAVGTAGVLLLFLFTFLRAVL